MIPATSTSVGFQTSATRATRPKPTSATRATRLPPPVATQATRREMGEECSVFSFQQDRKRSPRTAMPHRRILPPAPSHFHRCTISHDPRSGVGYLIAAVVSGKRAASNRAPKNARPEVARMTIIDRQPHPVNRTSPARLRARTHHS